MLVLRDAVVFNVSEIELALTCRRKWYNQYVRWIDVPPSQAQAEGIRWHVYAENLLRQRESLGLEREPLWMRAGLEELRQWVAEWNPTVLETETPIFYETEEVMSRKRIVFIGRLDAIVESGSNQRIWHLQHKTVRAGLSVAHFCALQGVSWHEALYGAMLRQKYAGRYAGSMLCIVKKRTTGPFFEAHPTYIQGVNSVIAELTDYARELYGNIMRTVAPPRMNRTACYGIWQNSRCPFFHDCHSVVPGVRERRTVPYSSYPVEFMDTLEARFGPREEV